MGVKVQTDKRGRLQRVECGKCGDSVLGGGHEYLSGWITGHFPRCDPEGYVAFAFQADARRPVVPANAPPR